MEQYIGGWQKLLNDAMKWLLIIIPISTGLALGYFALLKQWSDGDPGVASSSNRHMRIALFAGSIGMASAGIAKGFLSYFGG